MANQRREAVSYRPFRVAPVLSEGLLGVKRDDGELERKAAAGFARMADQFGQKADREAAIAGERAGRAAAMAGAPGAASVSGGEQTTASVNGQAGHIAGARGGVRVYTGPEAEQAKAIIRDEEGFRPEPYWDVNAWRIGYGSDTVTLADGRSVKVTPGMKISREDAERDLDYRLSAREGAAARRQLGEGWDVLPPNVQAVLKSVAYNYGSLPNSVVEAAKGGDLGQIASAVRGLGANPKRRAREASLISAAGSAEPIAPQMRPFQPGEKIQNSDGTYSTERTETYQLPDGKWVNAPSLWMAGDKPVDLAGNEGEIIKALDGFEKASGNRFRRFDSVAAAESAAQARSQDGGADAGSPYDQSAPPKSYREIPASSVGPVTVTPVDRPVEVTRGTPGGFRPTGRDTIYGRAYDVAGTKTYLQDLELTMLQDQQAVYDAYKDDPAKLQKAYDELLEAHMGDHVFEEIAPEYSAAFRKRSMGLVENARSAAEEKRKAQDRMSFIGRVEDMENAKSRALAGLDPSSDAATAELSRLQGTIDDHYDTAVARGVLTPAEAEKAKRGSRSDMLTGFYTKQASTMRADEIRTMRADMTRDYADGKLEGVSADDWTRIESGLIAAEKARETQDAKADADLKKRGDDLAKRVAKGLAVTPDELARFQLDAGTAPNGAKISASTLSLMRVSEAIRTLPIGEVEKRLPALIGNEAGPDDIDAARGLVASHRKEISADPIGVAERFGVLPVSPGLPLDEGADADSVSIAFAERINQARVAARHFGVSPRYFRPGEAEAIEAAVTGDPANGLAIAAGLVDAAGRDAQRVLAELGETAPAVAGAGEIMAVGGDPRAARDLLAGHGKTPDGKAYPDRAITKRIPQARAIAGEALAFAPEQINRLDEQAAAIARKRLYDGGIDPKSEDAKPVYERAFQEAAGATYAGNVRFGGFAPYDPGVRWKERQVLVSPTIRADRFGDVIGALEDSDIGAVKAKNGKAWTAADFKRAMPVAVSGGYVFALGDPSSAAPMFIADEKGDPLVLDLANMAGLKARVPEAFR